MGKCLSCLASLGALIRPNEEGAIPLTPSRKPKLPGSGGTELPKPPTEVKPPEGSSTEDQVLVVQSVDLCVSENVNNHHTSEYDLVQKDKPKPVLRRGFPFKVKVAFNRIYNGEKDAICLVFTVKGAPNPTYAQGTMNVIPVVPAGDDVLPSDGWQARLLFVDDKSATLEVTSVPNTIVGEWTLDIDTKLKAARDEDAQTLRYSVKDPLFLIFNPWSKQDPVYMSDPECRKEYVLNESGLIWRGSHNRLRPCIWNYGQFQENVLECCCHVLSHVGRLGIVGRADPIRVVRHISSVVNSPDDNGILMGNWSGDYSGGQSPTSWGGSVAILQQFFKTKKPVKFGQCWVFSGVCTTVCRALGIPARGITNFSSAHDTHNSLTIDYFFDEEGEPIERLNIDSIWNFHVWNEVWMERPDLEPGGYGGWQAIDATPQEESDGAFRCGPTSVVAIKRGEVHKPYDTSFLFSEVNADKVYWRYRGPCQPLKLIAKKTDIIGQFLSTKAVGRFERDDVTEEYKYAEESKEERETMVRALRSCRNVFSRYYLNDDFEDVQFDFELLDDIIIGSPFSVKLKAKNKNNKNKDYTLKVILRVDTMLYTGQLKNLVKKDTFEIKLAAGVEEEMKMSVSYDEYDKVLVEHCAFNIAALATVEETAFDYYAQDDFRVRKPDIVIETEGDFVQGQEFTVQATLLNPLPKPLTKAMFILEGPGISQPIKLTLKGNIPPEKEAKVSCKLIPKTPGEKTIVAKFQSKELEDVDGFKNINVRPKANLTNKPDSNN
ncbi:annulin-like isoform X1 [Tachypleus tridentatus]|uniref:annulin-like isoform X1 n=1 Tax=Tachypleus tridentatus TaxID=6853 RepID=UPI003FD6A493